MRRFIPRLPHIKIHPSRKTKKIGFIFFVTAILLVLYGLSVTKLPESNPVGNALRNITSRIITLNNTVSLVAPKSNFSRGEAPSFTLTTPIKSSAQTGTTATSTWKSSFEVIKASVRNTTSKISIPVEIKKVQNGKFQITAADTKLFKPGNYTLEVEASESIVYTRNLTQDFSWGVLAINTNKSIYAPGETAKLSFGVVDELGHTVCDATITAVIISPNGKKTELSTKNHLINKSPECKGDTYTLLPDYSATYQTGGAGKYQMDVTATTLDGSHMIQDYFEVRKNAPFDVERTQFPSRMYPRSKYPVKITIKAHENYTGPVTDLVPKDFRIYDISGTGEYTNQSLTLDDSRLYNTQLLEKSEQDTLATLVKQNPVQASSAAALTVDKTAQPITWSVNWEKGKTYTLSYTIVFPLKSPEFYLLGPLKIGGFEEVRQWQIAGDAVKCWDGGGSGNNWSTAQNWDGDTAPATTDVATFGETGACSAVVGSPDKDVSVNSGFVNPSGTGGGINIQSSYGGIMTQGTGVTITVGDQGFVQAGGTFTGSNSNITIQGGGDFNLSGGVFTTTSGTINVGDDWTISGGTFTASSGTVNFEVIDTDSTITGSATFNNLTFEGRNGSGSGGASTSVIASGTTLTVSGTLTISDSGAGTGVDFLNGPGGITANAGITLSSKGYQGDAVITLSNTASPTITGDASTNSYLPGININKSSGTVTFTNKIYIAAGGWTYSQGTLSFGSSTVGFGAPSTGSLTITGDTTFGNLNFQGQSGSGSGGGSTVTIASGTDIVATGTLAFVDDTNGGADYLNGPGTITADADVTITGGGFAGSAKILFTNSATQTVTGTSTLSDQSTLPGISVNKSGGSLSFANYVFLGTGGWTNTAGSLSFGTSTIGFRSTTSGADASGISGSTSFNNLYFSAQTGSGTGDTVTISTGTTVTVAGTLTLNAASGTSTNKIDASGTGAMVVQGDIATGGGSGSGWNGSVPVTFSGTASQSVTANSRFPDGTVTVNKSSGAVTLASNLSLNTSGQDLTISSGTLNIAGFNLTVNDQFVIGTSGTLKLQGGETVSAVDTFSTGSTVEYTGAGTYSSLLLGTSYYNLTISGAGSFTIGSSTTVSGTFTQSAGTFSLSSFTLSVGKDFAKPSGTFTASTGTVRFTTPSQTSIISGNTTFYNLLSIAAGKALQFANGTTQTISNNLTLTGTRNNHITLDSTTPGSQWDIIVSGSANVSYVSVQDSDACSGNTITATISADRGNNTCWTFSGSTAVGWYNGAWTKRKVVIINHTKVADDLVNFPLLVNISSDADMAANAQADGDDILFTSDDGTTKLSHEIEKYTTATGALVAWVRIPALSSSSDVNIYMYFGNAAATNQQDTPDGSNDVFDTNYKMVQHLGEATSCPQVFNDSTSNNNDGSCTSTVTAASGKIGGAQDVSAGFVHVLASSSMDTASAITMQGWINATTQGTGPFMNYNNNAGNLGPFMWRFDTYQKFFWEPVFTDNTATNVMSGAVMNTSTWHFVVGTFDGTTSRAYVDGQEVGTPTSVSKTLRTSYDFYIGGYPAIPTYFPGSIDEVKISNTARSAAWILTEYNNQADPTTFYSVSSSTVEAPRVQLKGGVRIQQGTRLYSQ